MMTEITPFFTKIFTTNLSDYSHLIPNVYELRKFHPDGDEISNVGGWQSPKYYFGDLDWMESLQNEITPHISEIYAKYGIETLTPNNFWFNINHKYNYNNSHTHTHNYFSGVVYLKAPKNSGRITFERPDNLHDFLNAPQLTDYNYGIYWIEPVENSLIIFPSNLRHYVTQSHSDEDRISIAFNFK